MTFEQLFLDAIGAIAIIVGTLTVQWIISRFSQQDRLASLQAMNTVLQSESTKREAALQKQIDELQSKILELEKYVAEKLSRKSLRETFTLDHNAGTLVKDGRHFCLSCFEGNDPPIESPVVSRNGCQICAHCRKVFS